MNTPLCDFVEQYRQSNISRFHMPGHKGQMVSSAPFDIGGADSCYPWDITEIQGADDLYHAEDIILASEQNATSLFGSRQTFYSTEGSSQCIRAMLFLALQHASVSGRPYIMAARNAHKTFLYACALLDLDVYWLYPDKADNTHSLCTCPISPETLKEHLACLSEQERPFAVYITSPDYLGTMQDISGLAKVCHQFHLPLLVDNAHGAYLHFLTPSIHPLDLGCDLCCDSAHKTLPALTGCAYLHVGKDAVYPYETEVRHAMALFGSTSPSYLLLQSLDRCNMILEKDYPVQLADCIAERNRICRILSQKGYSFLNVSSASAHAYDELRIVFDAGAMHTNGNLLADFLREQKIECEYADQDYVVLMLTPYNRPLDFNRLETLPAFTKSFHSPISAKCSIPAVTPGQSVCSIRQAIFAPSKTVSLEQAHGKICAAPAVSCPPAIPVIISGELISDEVIELCRHYQIDHLQVVI